MENSPITNVNCETTLWLSKTPRKQTWHENQLLPIFFLDTLGRVKVISALFICFSPLKSASGFADFSRRLRRRELQIQSRELALSIADQIEFIGHWGTEGVNGVSEHFSDEEKEICVSACERMLLLHWPTFSGSAPHRQKR